MGLYEKALYHLHRAAWLAPQNTAVAAALREVRETLTEFQKTYGPKRRSRKELEDRMKRDGDFGLTEEEIELLFEAGVMPWDYAVDEVIAAGKNCVGEDNGWASADESDTEDKLAARLAITRIGDSGPSASRSERPVRHRQLICQNCYKSKAEGTKLLKCIRCGIATYCSKECQKAHWSEHKVQCDINAPRKDMAMDSESLFHQLRSWVSRHRPTLSENLAWGLNLPNDHTAHERKVMVYILEYQPNTKRTAAKFKVKIADAITIQSLLTIHPTFHSLPEQRRLRNAETKARVPGSLGVAMYVLLAFHGDEPAINVVPVALGMQALEDPAPPGWKEIMIHTLNSGVAR